MSGDRTARDKTPVWRHSRTVCALSDRDRHLGHVVFTGGQWHAYDATHLNDDRDGYKDLGVYRDVAVAKAAVEASVAGNVPSHTWIS